MENWLGENDILPTDDAAFMRAASFRLEYLEQ